MLRFTTGLTALLLMMAAPAWSDPGSYPEYAKVVPSDKIAIRYVRVEELVQHILDRKPLTLVDVRQPRAYAAPNPPYQRGPLHTARRLFQRRGSRAAGGTRRPLLSVPSPLGQFGL